MPHEIPSDIRNTKKVTPPTQKSGQSGGPTGPDREVTQASYGSPKPGFNGGRGF